MNNLDVAEITTEGRVNSSSREHTPTPHLDKMTRYVDWTAWIDVLATPTGRRNL